MSSGQQNQEPLVCPLPTAHCPLIQAERVGVEPTSPFGSPVFETGAIASWLALPFQAGVAGFEPAACRLTAARSPVELRNPSRPAFVTCRPGTRLRAGRPRRNQIQYGPSPCTPIRFTESARRFRFAFFSGRDREAGNEKGLPGRRPRRPFRVIIGANRAYRGGISCAAHGRVQSRPWAVAIGNREPLDPSWLSFM